MSQENCPVCGHDLGSTLGDLEIREIEKDEHFECPYCEAKIKAHMEWYYVVEGDGCFVCPHCGQNDFADNYELDAHIGYNEKCLAKRAASNGNNNIEVKKNE